MEKKEQIKKVSQIILEYLNDSPDLEEAKSETIFMARDIDALYSDPPSPKMVCPKPLYICPLAKECGERCLWPSHQKPHENMASSCNLCNGNKTGIGSIGCPACVPYVSDPPSPKMVCPECDGKGATQSHPSDYAIVKCGTCNGTGKVPSPEPPEKVSIGTIPYLKEFREIIIKIQDETAKAQILKLQQAGWADNKEAIQLIYRKAYVEARQQALKEVGEWLSQFPVLTDSDPDSGNYIEIPAFYTEQLKQG